jgi:hypothetical protein
MDPASLAATAMTVVVPYLTQFGDEAVKGAGASAGKSVWDWITGKLSSPAGKEVVADLAAAPAAPENALAVQAALAKALARDPEAIEALAQLLREQGAAGATQNARVEGVGHTVVLAAGSTVRIR